VPAFNPLTAPCDYILLSGLKSPGIAEVIGASSPRNWDIREGFGLSGAFLVYKGRGLAKFSVRLTFTESEHWTLWEAWKPLVMNLPRKRFSQGKDSGALDIWHPILEDLGIAAVAVEEVLQPTAGDTGDWSVEIKFIEFRRPKIALAKPDGAQATPGDPVEDQVIKPLMEQFQRLAAE
jgi:hypothetical protein